MWGDLVGASWNKYGASWLGRVGFGANRLAPILSHVCPVHVEHIAEQNKPVLCYLQLIMQPTLQLHEIIFKTRSGAPGRSVPIG